MKAMFQPFTLPSQFYPGLILWCDPHSYDMEMSTLAPGQEYDHKKAREPKPCLVVAVDAAREMIQVARLCATTPTDTRKWVRVDTTPPITWRLPDAWIWVGKPGTVKMVFNDPRVMHPHKDTSYSTPPISTANLQNYWAHRNNYISWRNMRDQSAGAQAGSSGAHQHQQARGSGASSAHALYATPPLSPRHHSQATTHSPSGYFPALPGGANLPAPQMYNLPVPALGPLPSPHARHGPAQLPMSPGFNTLSAHPVVVPTGFTERHASYPGWWRNPETGWFWHAARGLMPPHAMTPNGPQ